jgi:hypothetical protein
LKREETQGHDKIVVGASNRTKRMVRERRFNVMDRTNVSSL